MSLTNRHKRNLKAGIVFASRAGDFVENRIGKAIENSGRKAEDLPDEPKPMTWVKGLRLFQ